MTFGFKLHFRSGLAALGVLFVTAAPWAAQAARPPSGYVAAGQPERTLPATQPARIGGFAGLRFGMTEAQAREATAKAFGADAAARFAPDDGGPGRTAIHTTIPLQQAGVPAELGLAFRGGELVQVNVVWKMDHPSDADRAKLLEVSASTVQGLLARTWPLFAVTRGKAIGDNAVLVFSGADVRGDGAEVTLFGVTYDVKQAGGNVLHSSPAAGPAAMRLSFRRDIYDRFVLPAGAF